MTQAGFVDADPEIISHLVGQIYEAAYDPAAWPVVVERVRGILHGSKACLVRIGPDMGPSDAIAANTDQAFQARASVVAEMAAEFINVAAAVPVGLIYNDNTAYGHDRLRASQFWNEWMAPQDMYDGLVCKLLESKPSFWALDVQRGRNQEAFAAHDVALFAFITPHIRRAVEIGRALQTRQATSLAYSQLPFGIVLVNGFQRIVSMNEAAEAICAQPESPVLNLGGHLVTTDAASTRTLRRLVVDACIVRSHVAPGLGGDFLLRTQRHGDPVLLSISVGPYNDRGGIPMERCAVVVIREMTFDLPDGFTGQIRSLFDLTLKEAEIAASLAAGISLKDTAQAANIRFSTARSHLERIFQKTGTNQQSQLVALLKGVLPVLRRP